MANAFNFAVIEPGDFMLNDSAEVPVMTAVVRATRPFRELILSWEAETPGESQLEFIVRPAVSQERVYNMGVWSASAKRTSVNDQKDELGEVQTDILILREDCITFRVDVRLMATENAKPKLKKLYAILTPATPVESGLMGNRAAWGKLIDAPKKAQMDYPGGQSLCSPTSVSMIVNHWGLQKNVPAWIQDVPDVQKGVHDPGWGGTGNWPFNTAYASSLPGMQGFITRLRGIEDLEHWIVAGVPVATSVSYSLLKGEPKRRANDGHLVVLVGFTQTGDPIFNDPGRKEIRLTYPRSNFEQSLSSSKRTVYIIKPIDWRGPSISGPWPTQS